MAKRNLALGAAVVGGLAAGAYALTRKKPKKKNGLPAPLVAAYEYGDVTIAVWKQPKAPPAKGTEYAWALFNMEPEEVVGSKSGGKWVPPVQILANSGAEASLAAAKAAAQAAADAAGGGLPVNLEAVYDFAGFVVAVWHSGRDASKPYEWLLFPGGTIDSVRQSEVAASPPAQGSVWIPPDGIEVVVSGRAADVAAAKKAAENATKQAVGEPASSGGGSGGRPPPVPEALIVAYPDGGDLRALPRRPGVDEAVAAADCSVIGTGPLFWERAGNLVGYLLHQGQTGTTAVRDAVLRAFLPSCADRHGPGIDALRSAITDAVRDAKTHAPAQPIGPIPAHSA